MRALTRVTTSSFFLLFKQQGTVPRRLFRSKAAVESLHSHLRSAARSTTSLPHHLALYAYPSFSGAFAALFAHIFHSSLGLPFLALPFSSIEPFRIEDFQIKGVDVCYLLDFVGPKDFLFGLSRIVPRVVAFDHRASTASTVLSFGALPDNLELKLDTKKNSARAVYDYLSAILVEEKSSMARSEGIDGLLKPGDRDRVEAVVQYIEDIALRRWSLPDVNSFHMAIKEERSKLNCVTNPHMFEQLLELDSINLIAKGKSCKDSRQNAANKLLGKAFKIQLGRGLYGECLAVRADGNSNLSNEIGLELSRRSAEYGLRPIGAVVFMQRGNLKVCLRSTDNGTDTLEVAKVYGGGGKPSSSSFIIRMDEYNQWVSSSSS